MASRGRSAVAGEGPHSDRSYDSSPDPLALSFNDNTPASRRKSVARNPMTASSPTKQHRRLEASEMMFSSPSKSMIMSTPRGPGASPWRIKVTVQAEPGTDEDNAESPSVKRVTRTKTTTVPLKDHDMSSPVKRPRGRPRKSDIAASPIPKPERKGTPVKRTARSRSRDTNVRVGESSAADVDIDVPPKRRRGHPRKSVQPSTEHDGIIVDEPIRDITPALYSSSVAGGSKKNARFVNTSDPAPRMPSVETPDTPIRIAQGRNLRARKGTPHANKVVRIESEDDEDSDVLTPTSEVEDNAFRTNQDRYVSEEREGSLLTPSETSAHSSDGSDESGDADGDYDDEIPDAQEYEDEPGEQNATTKYAFDEGTTRKLDDTTVLDSETFSMISVESLRNNGARSSPLQPDEMQNIKASASGSMLRNEYLRPSSSEPPSRQEQTLLPSQGLTAEAAASSGRPKLSRHVTPALDAEIPSAPPAAPRSSASKSQSPGLGRAVTAGVALQGLLDPSRLTPEASQKALDENRDQLDDLFRGFSESTRKELQAGLRLGEQLAEGQTKEASPPFPSSPTRGPSKTAPKQGVFRTRRKYSQSRLLTPEDQDHVVTPAEPTAMADVQYPTLNADEMESAPLSPARSENEMSWRVDTPSRGAVNAAQESVATAEDEAKESESAQQDDYADIWQEEASRSSNLEGEAPADEGSPVHDLFTEDVPARPTRGKVSRTWRRKNASDSHNRDEAESSKEPTSTGTHLGMSNQVDDNVDEAIDDESPLVEDQEMHDGEGLGAGGEESDDTGLFFQSNMPNVFNPKRPSRFENRRQRKQEAEKISLSALLDQGESFVPESSPPTGTKKLSAITKTNPFVDTPPRFPALMSSPKKSSPLRRELYSADISTSSVQQFEESTLPLAQSSPFRTIVDGDSKVSAASDQQQFRREMEGDTASTIVRVREEANEYLDAYEPQERSLNEITEVTEPSRTRQEQSLIPSSPPNMQRRFEQKLLSARKPSTLSNAVSQSDDASTPRPQQPSSSRPSRRPQRVDSTPETSSSDEASSRADEQTRTSPLIQPSRLSRVKSTTILPPVVAAPPAPHPILSRLTPLPKVEPWTKTHYKALDKLYTTHLKHPALFCPSMSPPTPLSNTNGYLLRQFVAAHSNLPYVGATFHAWGYSMLMTEELVVLCAVFLQLLSLESMTEYEVVAGKRIQMGNCAPGRSGDAITGEEVLKRLATVVMGESVRRDEKEGRHIDRSLGLEVEWPRRGR
ncbi:at dna binding [Pyrenophora seminiperda CCB06]|uniref:At dna binding n=1 Tax=Pyrenophora seminiperda CCB06 TaxID=1302712 RepID=A0A3M7MGY1_9PLEO|nr:at dna binding [Pyrenophora seminiperda CCB06]